MNSFLAFLFCFLVIVGGIGWLLRGAVGSIATQAAEHAKTFAAAYVKCTALVALAMGGVFVETFSTLSQETAARMAWWGWAVLMWKPLAAGLAVLVAFLDQSAQRAGAKRDAEKGLSNPPFPKTTTP